MKFIQYVCMVMTIFFGVFTVAFIAMGHTSNIYQGIFLTVLFAFLAYRAHDDIKKKLVKKGII